MGSIRVRVDNQVRDDSEVAKRRGDHTEKIVFEGLSGIVPLDTGELSSSLLEITDQLGELFGNIKRVGDFRLAQIQVGLEISAEGGFNLIGSAKAGGKGSITLTFNPGSES